jgi:hypothetical protein
MKQGDATLGAKKYGSSNIFFLPSTSTWLSQINAGTGALSYQISNSIAGGTTSNYIFQAL